MKIEIPAVEGFFTVEEEAHLIGGRLKNLEVIVFQKILEVLTPIFLKMKWKKFF